MPISYGQVEGRKSGTPQQLFDPAHPKPTRYPARERNWSGAVGESKYKRGGAAKPDEPSNGTRETDEPGRRGRENRSCGHSGKEGQWKS